MYLHINCSCSQQEKQPHKPIDIPLCSLSIVAWCHTLIIPPIAVLLFRTLRRICDKPATPSASFNRGCYIVSQPKLYHLPWGSLLHYYLSPPRPRLLHHYPSSESVLGGRFWVLFCIFDMSCSSTSANWHAKTTTCFPATSRHPILGGWLLFVHEIYKHIAPPPQVDITTPPTTKDPSPHRLKIHSMPHYCKEGRRQ